MNKRKPLWVLSPVFGTMIFVILYFIATRFYPGGSQISKNSVGFSWINNYWCNLLNETAINGQHNPAKPIAFTGMIFLCLSLSYFWFVFSSQISIGKCLKIIIPLSGTLAMIIALFLGTEINHDLVTNLASMLGLVATVGTFIGLYKRKWYGLFLIGLVNVLFVGLNNYFYYTERLIIYLPVIQKFSFAFFLLWVCCINIRLYRIMSMDRSLRH